jgi:8-oxo-dGTP pyrophosphatase MutT (NUDIX family)
MTVLLVSEALAKSHNSGYTKKDGTVVHPFDDKRYKKPAKWSATGSMSNFKPAGYSSNQITAPQYGIGGHKASQSGYGGGSWGSSGSLFADAPKPKPKAYHPKPGDKGQQIGIYNPHVPAVAALSNPGEIATITPGCEMPESLNGIAFTSWTPPAEEDWDYVDGQMDDLDEPVLHVPKGKEAASGLVIVEPDGRAWVVSPTNRFGGYKNTFPKGKVEPELSFQSNAIKEAWEEGGIKANVIGLLGDVERTTSVTRYYLARRVAGNPSADVGWESQAVHLVPIGKLTDFLDAKVDHSVVDLLAG